jgi:hypothetical protein
MNPSAVRSRAPFGGLERAPLFSRPGGLKNGAVIYWTALGEGIPLAGCLNVSILSPIWLSAAENREITPTPPA